jgi:ABC-2 type transport system ATP-binding protein
MVVVRAAGLVKTFESTQAIDGVDFEVQAGEVRGLLGPNGAGKTTLLRLLFGLVSPDAGLIELFGRVVDGQDPAGLEGVGGFVEDPSFYPYLSGRTNLELLAELDGPPAAQRIDAALDTVGMTDRAKDRCNSYSSGMRQRLGIAAALLRAPRLLLLDEPTSGLDPAGVRDVSALVQQLSSEGVAVVLSSHQIGELEQLCDSFTFIVGGRVVFNGSAAEMTAQAPASAYALITSDEARAIEVAEGHPGVRIERSLRRGRLRIDVAEGSLDPYVIALGRADVALRRLELLASPLETMYFTLTGDPDRTLASHAELASKESGESLSGSSTGVSSP